MRRVNLEQDTREWLDYKRTRIGGSGAKATAVPLTRGADRVPAGFWDLVANKLTNPTELDGEDPRDRGHRLETEAVGLLEKQTGLKFNSKPTPWVSEEDEDLMLSSDADEPVEVPTYDAEIKSFTKWGQHFKLLHKLQDGEDGMGLLKMGGTDFKHQILHGFVVNPNLKTRYFASYCPEAAYEKHRLAIVPIHREDYEDEIKTLKEQELNALENAREIVNELIGDDF